MEIFATLSKKILSVKTSLCGFAENLSLIFSRSVDFFKVFDEINEV
jgi:hypothetical protein